jgi:alpha-1,3-rhamnosyl/mannosyltransferase
VRREDLGQDCSSRERLRVGFDARWYNDSGVGTYIAGLLEALSRLSTVELVVYENPDNPVPDLQADCMRRPVRSGRYSPIAQFELARLCRQDRLHVFHSPFYMVPFLTDSPVVITVHDLIPFLFPIDRQAKQRLVKMGHKAAVKKAAHLIVVSWHTARDLQSILQIPSEQITVIHNAARRDLFRPEKQPGELQYLRDRYEIQACYVVVASARNWQTKNLSAAMAALDIARKSSGRNFQTVVFGPENGLKALKSAPENLRRLGHIPARDLAILFRNAKLFIAPSFYEGFGLPVLEAMSCGCAVIASSGGALPEVVADGGQVFAPMDITGMAHAIAELLSHPDMLHRWRDSALQRAADFSWERAARETLGVYHRVAFGQAPERTAAAAD